MMLLYEFVIYNLIIGLCVYIAIKTKDFGICLLFSIMAAFFIFKFMYVDVSYSYELVKSNATAYINASNYTVTNYSYTPLKSFTISKGDTIFLYMAVVAMLMINVTKKLFSRRKR